MNPRFYLFLRHVEHLLLDAACLIQPRITGHYIQGLRLMYPSASPNLCSGTISTAMFSHLKKRIVSIKTVDHIDRNNIGVLAISTTYMYVLTIVTRY